MWRSVCPAKCIFVGDKRKKSVLTVVMIHKASVFFTRRYPEESRLEKWMTVTVQLAAMPTRTKLKQWHEIIYNPDIPDFPNWFKAMFGNFSATHGKFLH